MPRLEEFKSDFMARVRGLSGVREVEFFGSLATGNFVVGKSDMDIFVHGDNIPGSVKRRVSNILRELVRTYGLAVEKAPYQHPTPVFIDSPLRRLFYTAFKARVINAEGLRQWAKRVAPTHEAVWRTEDELRERMEYWEKRYRLPPLSRFLDKLR